MDNSIFAIGAKDTEIRVSDEALSSAADFENAFETAKNNTNYTDKKDLRPTNEKVANVAEKSVDRRKESSDSTNADITKVSKKVSKKITTKSPKSAMVKEQEFSKAQNTATQKESGVKITEDASLFAVKENLSTSEPQEEVVATTPVETGDTVKLQSSVQEEAVSAELSEAPVEDGAGIVEEVTVAPAVDASSDEQLVVSQIANALNVVQTKPSAEEVVEVDSQTVNMLSDSVLSVVEEDSLELAVENKQVVDAELEQNAEADSAIETKSSSVILDENWELVDEQESKEILNSLDLSKVEDSSVDSKTGVSNSAQQVVVDEDNDIPVDSVKIEAEVEESLTVESGEKSDTITGAAINIDEDVESAIDIEEQDLITGDKEIILDEKSISRDAEIDSVVNVNAESQAVEYLESEVDNLNEFEITSQKDFEVKTDNVEEPVVKQEVVLEQDSEVSVRQEQNVDIVEEVTTNTQKLSDAIEKVVTTTKPTTASKDEDEEDDGNAAVSDLLLEEVDEFSDSADVKLAVDVEADTTNSGVDLLLNAEDDSEKFDTNLSQAYSNEDLDLYIDNCIKLAFVDTTSQAQSEEIDIVSALETKFEDSFAQEGDVDFEMQDVDLDEYENISSLEEVVDVQEVETLGLRLKDSSYSATSSDKAVSSVTPSSTTEQLIRYSIEGESSLNSTTQFEFSKFAPEAVKAPQQEISGKEILSQLSEKLSTFSFKAGSKLTMQLNPENLGKIELTLRNTAEGIIAEMTASSDDAADMLKKNLDDLKETLQKYGVRFDNVSVKTTAAQQSAQNQDYTQQEGGQKQQHEQKRDSERQDKKQFDEMMNSFTEEDKE